ncbi:hypothetical protein JCM10212_000188 [Sporobolomyces blumeae]
MPPWLVPHSTPLTTPLRAYDLARRQEQASDTTSATASPTPQSDPSSSSPDAPTSSTSVAATSRTTESPTTTSSPASSAQTSSTMEQPSSSDPSTSADASTSNPAAETTTTTPQTSAATSASPAPSSSSSSRTTQAPTTTTAAPTTTSASPSGSSSDPPASSTASSSEFTTSPSSSSSPSSSAPVTTDSTTSAAEPTTTSAAASSSSTTLAPSSPSASSPDPASSSSSARPSSSSSSSSPPSQASSSSTPAGADASSASPSEAVSASSIRSATEASAASPTTATAESTAQNVDTSETANTTPQQAAATSSDTSLYTRTQTTQYTLTSSGSVVIVTSLVTAVITGSDPSASGGSKSLNGSASSGNAFFNNTGAVAGTFVVVGLLAAGIVIGLGLFFVRRKRARQLDEDLRVAAGGAGDGGAGKNRFNDDDDDDEVDGIYGGEGAMSEGHNSGYMSSYGSILPLVAGGGSYGGHGQRPMSNYYSSGSVPRVGNGGGSGSFEPSHSPTRSSGSVPYQLPAFGAAYPTSQSLASYGGSQQNHGGGGVDGYATTRSHEGILHDNWAEYVEGAGLGAVAGAAGKRSPEGSSPGESGSQEGMLGSSNSHSQNDHAPKFRDSTESYYAPTVHLGHEPPMPYSTSNQANDYAAYRNSLYGGLAASESGGVGPSYGAGPAVPPKTVDDRLNPKMLEKGEGGEAASLADDHDYSRRILRVANPSDTSSIV